MAKKGGSAVYRVTEVIGTSTQSWEDAARNAVKTAAGTLRDLRIAEIEKLDVKVEGGKVVQFRARLADFRERLRWLMVRDPGAEDYTEHHVAGRLEYRFAPKKGIPFPALAEASGDFPELRVEAEWDHDGVRGRAVIENGRVVEEQSAAAEA